MTNAGSRLFEQLMRFRPDGMSANAWAVKAGVSRTIWADLRRHGNPSRRTLEKLLGAAGSSLAEFEALRVIDSHPAPAAEGGRLAEQAREWRRAATPPIPLLATRLAGRSGARQAIASLHSVDQSRIVGEVDRPRSLAGDPDAYAVIMMGETMWPRYRAGRRLLVSPAAPIAVGDDVMVRLAGDEVLINELVMQSSDMIELRQFNPAATFSIAPGDVEAMHKIVGEAI